MRYDSLSPPEQQFWNELLQLFALVQARQPEKGVITLLQRARLLAQEQHIPLEEALSVVYQGAHERTHARLQLLNQCDRPL